MLILPQVSEKELKRQLTRERERHKKSEEKLRESRSEVERLRVALSERPLVADKMPHHTSNPTFSQVIEQKKVWADI